MELTMVLNYSEYEMVRVSDVSSCEADSEVYDITVDSEDHCFFIVGNNGDNILTHNCDGYHILCLVVNFLLKYWPELFADGNNPFVNKLMTPYVLLKKGNKRKYIYHSDYHLFSPAKYKGWEIIRAKGLGTLQDEQWRDILETPQLIPFWNDGNLKEKLDLLFNPTRADDRKQWLEHPV